MPPARIPPTTPSRRWSWWPWRKVGPGLPVEPREDPLLQAGRLLRQQRESQGLSLRELAIETRVSTPVLEALERGWRERLPEPAYLRTMLTLLEQHLSLPAGSLECALPDEPETLQHGAAGGQALLSRFTPGSIDVFTTWQGTVLYGGLTLALIYGVNLQQRRLAAENLLALKPIPPLPAAEQQTPDPNAELLQAYPDLRPLDQAASGVAQQQVLEGPVEPRPAAGILQATLRLPTRISLESEAGMKTELNGATGQLVLQLQPPLRLRLEPAPAEGSVLWDGKPLAAEAAGGGRYRLPPGTGSGAAVPVRR
ncbi:RodZ family helix-turn-helix domain-containing protein [Synechococcus sp. CS-205]|jgi:transcriptional regulator with XRE-family HTH domain|uniref:helix-turn-helix domain-containing protein n=1 Tax=Synechococcus sp. CS-205 TaxID=2847984 RepID=UPI00223AE8C6|nr:helix-turn-helix transcriptional regulator [Synechococcus sp. CS-205]MCT0248773.1 helix-turn-helix domain-containing protein [Synechococcus sp. CS-205]